MSKDQVDYIAEHEIEIETISEGKQLPNDRDYWAIFSVPVDAAVEIMAKSLGLLPEKVYSWPLFDADEKIQHRHFLVLPKKSE